MSKKILSVLSHTEYGNLEDSDIGLFASAFAPAVGSKMAVLLTAKAQKQHDDPIWKDKTSHHTDAGKAHSTTAEFVERLLEKGHGEPHLNWYV